MKINFKDDSVEVLSASGEVSRAFDGKYYASITQI